MRNIFILSTLLIISFTCFSQPEIEWQKSLGGSATDYAESIQQTTDGGYIVTGASYSNDGDVAGNHGVSDYWIAKLNATGNLEWQKSLGGTNLEIANSIQQTGDGGFIVAGESKSNNGDVSGHHGSTDYRDFWIVKLSESGIIEWQKSLGGSDSDIAFDIQQTIDGGYIVAGVSNSNDGDVTINKGSSDYWVVKLTGSGAIEWQKSLGGGLQDIARSVKQTSDGGYIVAGHSNSSNGDVTGNHGSSDFWIVKLSMEGNLSWQKSLGGSQYDAAHSIFQTSEGDYIIAGNTESNNGDVMENNGGNDFWIVKLSTDGEIIWQNSLGGSVSDFGYDIKSTFDGGSIVAGFSSSIDGDVSENQGQGDFWLVKLNSLGNIEWQKSVGGTLSEVAYSVQQTMDGGFIAAGSSESNDGDVTGNHGGMDYWLVKLGPVLSVEGGILNNTILLFPNPNSGQFYLNLSPLKDVSSISIIDVLGRLVYSTTKISPGTIEINQNLAAGMYVVKVSSGTSEIKLKMIVK